MSRVDKTPEAPPEQIRYADLLFYGSWAAIGLMLITYVVYVAGILEPHVPVDKLPEYWRLPVHHYVEEAKIPLGWDWLRLIGAGDFLNFLGLVLLAGMTIICFLLLLPAYIRQKDIAFTIIVIVEILVLCLGASGILGVGAH